MLEEQNLPVLTNFTGAMIDGLSKQGYSDKDIKHLIVAALMETIENMTKKDNDGHDFYALKPVFRFFINLYQSENRRLSVDAYLPIIQKEMQQNSEVIHFFETKVNALEANLEENSGSKKSN